MKVLIYCQDSLGLGHLRRNVNIAHALSRKAPDTTFLFVADSPLAPFFALPPNSDFIKLPTIVKVDSGVWDAPDLPLNIKHMRKIRSRVLKKIAHHFRPDVFLVDHMAHGAMSELVGALKILRKKSPHTKILLGLRDILGDPEVIVRQWLLEGVFDIIDEYYDTILVYGCQDVYDVVSEYHFPEDLHPKVHYSGYVYANGSRGSSESVDLAGQFQEEKPYTILVMGGGGSDAHFMMDSVLNAIRYLGDKVPFNTYMLTGPFMPYADRQALLEKASQLPVIVRHMTGDSVSYLKSADLVTCMAGYNTICEVLGYSKKAVVIPRPGPSAEQGMRSQILHDRGLLVSIHPREVTPGLVAEAVLSQLYDQNGGKSAPIPDLNGASHVAQYILDNVDLEIE